MKKENLGNVIIELLYENLLTKAFHCNRLDMWFLNAGYYDKANIENVNDEDCCAFNVIRCAMTIALFALKRDLSRYPEQAKIVEKHFKTINNSDNLSIDTLSEILIDLDENGII